MTLRHLMVLATAILLAPSSVQAQGNAPQPNQPVARVTTIAQGLGALGVLVITLFAIHLATKLRSKDQQTISGKLWFQMVGLAIILGLAMGTVILGFANDIPPIILGLLGTALGFVFGKGDSDTQSKSGKPSVE